MNPVLQKDLLGLLRLKRVAVIQIAFVAVLSLMVLGTWPQGGVVVGTVTISQTTSATRLSDNLMLGLVLGQLVLLILLVPGIASVAITSEREAGTFEMLYASRLSPLQIILGKISLALAYPLLLLISGLPFVSLLAWRGELRTDQLLLSYGILLLSAFFLTMLCLAISALCRQGATSLVIAYLCVLVICGGVMVPAAIMLEGSSIPELASSLHYLRVLSPVAAVLSVLSPNVNDVGGVEHHMLPIWSVFLPTATILSVAAVAFIAIRLRKAPSTLEGFGAPAGGVEAKRSIMRRIFFLIDPSASRRPLGSGNPIIGKERRTSNLRSGRWMIRIFYFSLLMSLALTVMALYGGSEHADLMRYVVQVLIALQIALITLVVPSLSTGSISSEFENGTFEVLRLTPLRAGQIFWGKLLPSLVPAMLPTIALLPAYGALAMIAPKYVPYMLEIAPVIMLSVVAMCILGLTCSAWAINTARATVIAYLLASTVVVLPMLVWSAADIQLVSIDVARWVVAISPMAIAMNLIENGRPEIASLRNMHLCLVGGACVVMLLLARYRLAWLLRRG